MFSYTFPHDDFAGVETGAAVSSSFRPQTQFLHAFREPPGPTSQSSSVIKVNLICQ